MRNKLLKTAYIFLGVAFWIVLWHILSEYFVDSFIFPTPRDTAENLTVLLGEKKFYLTVLYSLGRILLGLLLGIFIGISLGVICYYVKPISYVISPAISVIRSTPVASIIIILWFFLSKISLPVVISLMMVTPIIWQSTIDAFGGRDKLLFEVAFVFEINRMKRFKLLVLPKLAEFLLPSIITSIGLAWKSGIAAEIITMTKNSIGREISNAKNDFLFAEMFAWTISVVALSLILETAMKSLIRKVGKNSANS